MVLQWQVAISDFEGSLFPVLMAPRPRTLLSPEKEEEIAKNLRKYSKKYEAEEQDVSTLLSEQEQERRRKLKEEWVRNWMKIHEQERVVRQQLRDGEASHEEEEYEAKEVEVEEVTNVTEEVVSFEYGQ